MASLYELVGGDGFFVTLVDRFYDGVADDEALRPMYPEAELDGAKLFSAPIVTTLEPFKAFYPAEDYHQDFLTLNPTYPYIVYNDLPKVANLKQLFPNLYSEKPVLVSEAKS